jgi:3-dehydroquinate synthase
MEPVTVTHGLGSYPVYVEPGILARLPDLLRLHLAGRRATMIADQTVFQLLREGKLGQARWGEEALTFPAGEKSKTRETWARLTDALLQSGHGRDSGLVVLGGGVAGDLAGFVAATYLRGIPYLLVPTTLLAMVDASVGGKTAVDTPQGKNLIGAFHPPVAVAADPLALISLPEREYRAGLAEAVKHGVIADRSYFEFIEWDADALMRREQTALTRLIRRSVEIKAAVVSADEREGGLRSILNAGHTVGHALELVSDFGLPHGEAVALGLVVECELAARLGLAPTGMRERVEGLLRRLGLPVRLDRPIAGDQLIAAMSGDKKNRGARLRFALPSDLGTMPAGNRWTVEAPDSAIKAALESVR